MADKRVIVIVLDSAGIGALPDAADFGDEGAHTFGNIYKVRGKLDIPNMRALGIAAIQDARLQPYDGEIQGCYGRSAVWRGAGVFGCSPEHLCH